MLQKIFYVVTVLLFITTFSTVDVKAKEEQFSLHLDGETWNYQPLKVNSKNIVAGVISEDKIQSNSISSFNIQNGQVKTPDLEDSCIDSSKLRYDSVTTNHIQDNSVDSSKLASDSVTEDKLASNSVGTRQLSMSSVSNEKLEDNSVTGTKIADATIETINLPDQSITSPKISDNSVSTNNIQDDSITSEKLKDNVINSPQLSSNSVENKHLTDDSVGSKELQSESVETVDISPQSVKTDKIKDVSVTSPKITLGSILAKHLSTDVKNKLYPCQVRECDKCEQKLNHTIESQPQFENYLIQQCSSEKQCSMINRSDGFHEWSSSGCKNFDGKEDSICGCCIQTIPGLDKIPPAKPRNLTAGNGTNQITWEPSYLGLPAATEYEIVCSNSNDNQKEISITVDAAHKSTKIKVQPAGYYECYVKVANGVGQPVVSDSTLFDFDFDPKMSLAPNGITILCSGLKDGTVDEVNGVQYTKRNRIQIDQLIKDGNDQLLETTCTSDITDMSSLFTQQSAFNANISSWDTSQVTDMSGMFGLTNFNQDIGDWDTSQVTNMGGMFSEASFDRDISGWNTSQVNIMDSMFNTASKFNQDINGWDVSRVTYMREMFREAVSFSQDIGDWDTSQVTDMGFMFNKASSFSSDLSAWNVPKVINCVRFGRDSGLIEEDLPNFTNCQP